MVDFNVPENINPKPFFEEFVPQQFKAVTDVTPIEGVEGIVFSLEFGIDGPNGGTWGIVVTDGKKMEIKPGGYDKALITMNLSEKDWRDAITGKAGLSFDMNAGMGSQLGGAQAKAQFEVLSNMKGKLVTELVKTDGSLFPVTIIFNKAENPETKVKLKMEDYLEMQSGKLDGANAFMQGKIQIDGDMMFAMQLSQLRF